MYQRCLKLLITCAHAKQCRQLSSPTTCACSFMNVTTEWFQSNFIGFTYCEFVLVKIGCFTIFNSYIIGNSPASTPGSSPRLGRKFQDGVPIGVLRLPRGPPQSTCKGFDLKFRRIALLNSTAAKLESGTFANHPAVVKWYQKTFPCLYSCV